MGGEWAQFFYLLSLVSALGLGFSLGRLSMMDVKKPKRTDEPRS